MGDETRKLFAKIVEDIMCGKFAREWMLEQKSGLTVFKKMMKRNLNHPINKSEQSLLKVIERVSEESLQRPASRSVKRTKLRAQRHE